MRRSRSSLVAYQLMLCAAFLLSAHSAQAQESECCIDMLFPIGARTVALGDAVTARPGEDAVFINPAGLAALPDDQFIAHRSSLADGKRTTLGVLLATQHVGVFGLAYHLIDFGSQETTDEFGNPTGTASIIFQQLVASYATNVGVGWSAGINYRIYDFRPSCSGASCAETAKPGTTHMVDLGLTYAPRWLTRSRLGVSLMHVGFPLQINNAAQADPTPARLRVGAAYEAGHHFARDTTLAVWVHVDAVQRVRDATAPALNFGVEVVLDRTILFRAGHSSEGDGITSGGTGIGLGLKYERFEVSVAKTVTASPLFEGEPFHVSFGVTF
ncbi:MAG: PorV/PorQ family protein [Gemmatimonadota bacterium]